MYSHSLVVPPNRPRLLSDFSPLSFPPQVSSSYATASGESNPSGASTSGLTDNATTSLGSSTTSSSLNRREIRRLHDLYTGELNPGADVLATTVAVAAWYAAIPPTVRIMEENFVPAKEVR